MNLIKRDYFPVAKDLNQFLDNFFKRKATNNIELKQFSCHICSTQVSTEKILKNHIKRLHPDYKPTNVPLLTIQNKPKGRPKNKKNSEEIDNQSLESNDIDTERRNGQGGFTDQGTESSN